jgi:hypothetical protein
MGHEIVGPQRISRLLFQSGHFSRGKNAVKARAFIPRKDRKLSVAYTDGLSDTQILGIANAVLAQMRLQNPNTNYYGRGDFLASDALVAVSKLSCLGRNALKIIKDDEGYPGHTTIVGWPEEDDVCEVIAGVIASCCRLELV